MGGYRCHVQWCEPEQLPAAGVNRHDRLVPFHGAWRQPYDPSNKTSSRWRVDHVPRTTTPTSRIPSAARDSSRFLELRLAPCPQSRGRGGGRLHARHNLPACD